MGCAHTQTERAAVALAVRASVLRVRDDYEQAVRRGIEGLSN
jgi:Arc/MetJ family transcription regulator